MYNNTQEPHTPTVLGTKRGRDSSDEEDAENFQPPSKRSSLEFATPPAVNPLAQSTPRMSNCGT